MRRFLLATVAIAALALAAPIAGAQYPEQPANPVYSSPSDPAMDEEQTPVPNATPPVDSQTTAAPYTQSNNTPLTTDTTVPPAQQAQSDPQMNAAPTQQAQANDPYAQPAQPYADGATGEPQQQYATTQQDMATAPDQYASAESTAGADITMSPTMVQYAQEAGLSGVPMSAAEVCAPRSVELGGTRLSHERRNQLEFAADRASACEIQRVTIQAPAGREGALRQTLVERGVDEASIEVEQAEELGVELTFAGVATSSEQYAAIFNAPQFASNAEATTQPLSYAPATQPSGYQQTSYTPATSPSAPTATPASYDTTMSPSPSYDAADDMTDVEQQPEEPIEDPLY